MQGKERSAWAVMKEGEGKEARGDQAKRPAAALVPRLHLGGLGAEGFWSSLFMTPPWDNNPKG